MATPEQNVQRLAAWLEKETDGAQARGVVFGISGGVDSAVVAALCKRALPNRCLGILMPCHSPKEDLEHGRLVAETFGIPTRTVDLDSVFDEFLEAVNAFHPEPGHKNLALANLKPRLRMATLYYFANLFECLVVGTANRTDWTLGYFTKHGDGGVDLLPLAGLVKSEVYELAHHLGVPHAILNKPPSGGLTPNQTDEKDLGFTYPMIDQYIMIGQGDPKVKEKVDELNRKTSHKKRLPLVPD